MRAWSVGAKRGCHGEILPIVRLLCRPRTLSFVNHLWRAVIRLIYVMEAPVFRDRGPTPVEGEVVTAARLTNLLRGAVTVDSERVYNDKP